MLVPAVILAGALALILLPGCGKARATKAEDPAVEEEAERTEREDDAAADRADRGGGTKKRKVNQNEEE